MFIDGHVTNMTDPDGLPKYWVVFLFITARRTVLVIRTPLAAVMLDRLRQAFF